MIWSLPLVYYLMNGGASVVNDRSTYASHQLPAAAITLQQIVYFPFQQRRVFKRSTRNENSDDSLETKIDKAVSNEAKDFADSDQRIIRPVLRAKIKAELAHKKAEEKAELANKKTELANKKTELANKKAELANKKASKLAVKVKGLYTNLKRCQRMRLKFTPRALLNSVKEKHKIEYYAYMESTRNEIRQMENKDKNCPGDIKYLMDQSKRPTLSAAEKKAKEDEATARKKECDNITTTLSMLKRKLPNLIWNTDNNRENRIQKKHVWLWMDEYKKTDRKMKEIRKYIQKWYDQKSEEYKREHTVEQYADYVYENLAEIEEDINNQEAHVLVDIPIKRGYEFKSLTIYGKKELDECATILINAIGLRDLVEDDSAEYMTVGAEIIKKNECT